MQHSHPAPHPAQKPPMQNPATARHSPRALPRAAPRQAAGPRQARRANQAAPRKHARRAKHTPRKHAVPGSVGGRNTAFAARRRSQSANWAYDPAAQGSLPAAVREHQDTCEFPVAVFRVIRQDLAGGVPGHVPRQVDKAVGRQRGRSTGSSSLILRIARGRATPIGHAGPWAAAPACDALPNCG